jgi:hypothetical protein
MLAFISFAQYKQNIHLCLIQIMEREAPFGPLWLDYGNTSAEDGGV